MSGLGIVIVGVIAFTLIVLALVAVILVAKDTLVPSGEVKIEINGDAANTLRVQPGDKLLNVLTAHKIFLPAACGGGGTCGQCKVRVLSGGGEILATERGFMSRQEIKSNVRLACQTPVKQDMKIELSSDVVSAKTWDCVVRSNENVAAFVKELVVELPEGADGEFKTGEYVMLTRPAKVLVRYRDFDVPEKYRDEWEKKKFLGLTSVAKEAVTRPYSLANYSQEKGILKFNLRVTALSAYFFGLKPGDKLSVQGSFGDFLVRDTSAEKVFIGEGVGLAQLRAHIYELLETLNHKEKISLWYGARTSGDAYYLDEFVKLEERRPNFSFNLALAAPDSDEAFPYCRGTVFKALYDHYLKDHKAPEDCEYFICCSAKETKATVAMLDNLGVESESIFFGNFG